MNSKFCIECGEKSVYEYQIFCNKCRAAFPKCSFDNKSLNEKKEVNTEIENIIDQSNVSNHRKATQAELDFIESSFKKQIEDELEIESKFSFKKLITSSIIIIIALMMFWGMFNTFFPRGFSFGLASIENIFSEETENSYQYFRFNIRTHSDPDFIYQSEFFSIDENIAFAPTITFPTDEYFIYKTFYSDKDEIGGFHFHTADSYGNHIYSYIMRGGSYLRRIESDEFINKHSDFLNKEPIVVFN